jgi:hypothetical protein
MATGKTMKILFFDDPDPGKPFLDPTFGKENQKLNQKKFQVPVYGDIPFSRSENVIIMR